MLIHQTSDFWSEFAQKENLNEEQLKKYISYYELLIEWNSRINLTAITKQEEVIAYHFQDSIRLGDIVDLNENICIADVGSGAGFPSLPLKIRYPHLAVVLIEVNLKRVRFLQEVIKKLDLDTVQISTLDWRTFLRQTHYPIDFFCARASLSIPELLHMCKPSCPYRQAGIVYWASDKWMAAKNVEKIIKKEYLYKVGTKKRKLVVFSCIECII
ncbi:MAG TPA: 16S rRNA (guanine(527)-N(7))-methyltransferase RsmG [Candidatus Babeliales bacterium]|jgi:16S rRNA (guanine527-N7)-methyltransferase|nr:16S rRNA (guanine(527)-N(7))-methyltransferase RsmG [Candidatus Babeliales bacterium]